MIDAYRTTAKTSHAERILQHEDISQFVFLLVAFGFTQQFLVVVVERGGDELDGFHVEQTHRLDDLLVTGQLLRVTHQCLARPLLCTVEIISYHLQGAAKKWTPKVFRCFISNRL